MLIENFPRSRRSVAAAVASALALSSVALGQASAAFATPQDGTRKIASAWIPYWSTAASTVNVTSHADLFQDASPYWFNLDYAGGSLVMRTTVSDTTRAKTDLALRQAGIPIMPMVSDGGTAKRELAAGLASATTRAQLVAAQRDIVVANDYAGLDLDYERFAFSDGTASWATTRPVWVQYVKELGAALHAAGKRLSVTTPGLYNGAQTSSSGYWVYDWEGIAPHIDLLRVMTYDYSVAAPGPIAPLSWVRKTMGYAAEALPAAKVQVGVPAYGRDWIARRADGTRMISGTCPSDNKPASSLAFTADDAESWLADRGVDTADSSYDEARAERTVTYTKTYSGTSAGGATTCTVTRTAWWVDAQGVVARAKIAGELGLAGIAVWQAGGISEDTWEPLRAYANEVRQRPTSATLRAEVTASGSSATSTKTVRVTGSATSDIGVASGTAVTVESRPTATAPWSTAARTTVGSSGGFAVDLPSSLRGTHLRAKIAGSWWRLPGVSPEISFPTVPVSVKPIAAKVTLAVPGRVKPSAKFAMRATVVPAGRVVIRREVWNNGAWKTTFTGRTDSSGKALFTIKAPRKATILRLRVTVTMANGKTLRSSTGRIVVR